MIVLALQASSSEWDVLLPSRKIWAFVGVVDCTDEPDLEVGDLV